MTPYLHQLRKSIAIIVALAFLSTSSGMPAFAQVMGDPMPHMPMPGVMVHLSPEFTPAYLKGMIIHPENAFKFDFIIYKGDQVLDESQKKQEYTRLIKYFLASLAVPDEDQWVNLSPYEKDRIIREDFGKTEMGRDLLAQDYLLKQITASLIYPQDKLGRQFWDAVYAKAYKQFGTTNIPMNTFNKVWIVPDEADIYEKGNIAYLYKSHLKVMLEEDYLSLKKHSGISANVIPNNTHSIGSQVIREIVLPQLEHEVNVAQNFAPLRQVFTGMILAAWYKRALRESLLGQIYANKGKVKGVDQDPRNNEIIYQRYLKAFKKGVFNYIKEDVDKYTNETIPRKYFSGGATLGVSNRIDPTTGEHVFEALKVNPPNALVNVQYAMSTDADLAGDDIARASVDPTQLKKNAAISSSQQAMIINLKPSDLNSQSARTVTQVISQTPWGSSVKPTEEYANIAKLSLSDQDFQDGPSNRSIPEWKTDNASYLLQGGTRTITNADYINMSLARMGVPEFKNRKRGVVAISVTPFEEKPKGNYLKKETFYTLDLFISPYSGIPHVNKNRNSVIHIYFSLTKRELDIILKELKNFPESLLAAFAASSDKKLSDIYYGMIQPSLEFPDAAHNGFYGWFNVGKTPIDGVSNETALATLKSDNKAMTGQYSEKQKGVAGPRVREHLRNVIISAGYTGNVEGLVNRALEQGFNDGELRDLVSLEKGKQQSIVMNIRRQLGITEAPQDHSAHARINNLRAVFGEAAMRTQEVLDQIPQAIREHQGPIVFFHHTEGTFTSAVKGMMDLRDRLHSETGQNVMVISKIYSVLLYADQKTTGDDIARQYSSSANARNIELISQGDNETRVDYWNRLVGLTRSGKYSVENNFEKESDINNYMGLFGNRLILFRDEQGVYVDGGQPVDVSDIEGKLGTFKMSYGQLALNFLKAHPALTFLISTVSAVGLSYTGSLLNDNIRFNRTVGGFHSPDPARYYVAAIRPPKGTIFAIGELTEEIHAGNNFNDDPSRGRVENARDELIFNHNLVPVTEEGNVVDFFVNGGESSHFPGNYQAAPDGEEIRVAISDTVSPERAKERLKKFGAMNNFTFPTNFFHVESKNTQQAMTASINVPKAKQLLAPILEDLADKEGLEKLSKLSEVYELLQFVHFKMGQVEGSANYEALHKISDGLNVFLVNSQRIMYMHHSRPSLVSSSTTQAITAQQAQIAGSLNRKGGIDFNAFNMNLHIKRDGNGVPLPVNQQDLAQIHIDGLVPVILGIEPAMKSPLFAQLANPPQARASV